MANSICENCWIVAGDMAKHLWEEHGVAPSSEAQERIARQKIEFHESLSGLDVHMEGEKKALAWGGTSK